MALNVIGPHIEAEAKKNHYCVSSAFHHDVEIIRSGDDGAELLAAVVRHVDLPAQLERVFQTVMTATAEPGRSV